MAGFTMWHGDIPKIDRPFEPMKASPVLFPLNATEVKACFFPFGEVSHGSHHRRLEERSSSHPAGCESRLNKKCFGMEGSHSWRPGVRDNQNLFTWLAVSNLQDMRDLRTLHDCSLHLSKKSSQFIRGTPL